EAQPVADLLEDRTGDVGVEAGAPAVTPERDALEELDRPLHGQVHHVADAVPVHQDRQALGLEALAAAGLARRLAHGLIGHSAYGVAAGLPAPGLDVPKDGFPIALVLAAAAGPVGLEL